MTREEAIKMLKYNSNVIHRTINGKTDPNEVAALDMAIKALEQESTEMTAEKEADNVRNSRLAIEAMHKQSCESYKFCKSCEDIAMAFQIGLLFGKADKAIEEVEKSITPQPCEDCISRLAVNELVDELARAISDERCCISRGRSTATIMRDILHLPPVTSNPKMGQWKRISRDLYVQHAMAYYEYSECGKKMIGTHNYCPNCGCKMKEAK